MTQPGRASKTWTGAAEEKRHYWKEEGLDRGGTMKAGGREGGSPLSLKEGK